MSSRKKWCIAGTLFAAVIVAWGARVYCLSAGIEKQQTEIYQIGEKVEYGKDFFYLASEAIEGYDITVLSAELKTYQEFVKEYGDKEVHFREEWMRPDYVYDVEVLIHNKNQEEDQGSGINLIETRLVSVDDSMQICDELFAMLYPHLEGQTGFALRPDSSMTMHFPYVQPGWAKKFLSHDKVVSSDWYLILTMYPVKKMIAVN